MVQYASIAPLLLPVIALAFGMAFYYFFKQGRDKADKARRASMESLSKKLQMEFYGDDMFGLTRQLKNFRLFSRERSRWMNKGRVSNVLRGRLGETDVYLFDYTYSVQSGKTRKIVSQTVFFANDKQWYLPDFFLKPENWWHKIQKALGLSNDINFEENKPFSDKFWLESHYEELIRQKITPELQGFLMQRPPAHLEGINYYLLAYFPQQRLQPSDVIGFFHHCKELVALLQKHNEASPLDLTEPMPVPHELKSRKNS